MTQAEKKMRVIERKMLKLKLYAKIHRIIHVFGCYPYHRGTVPRTFYYITLFEKNAQE